jgi:hypothetical protein
MGGSIGTVNRFKPGALMPKSDENEYSRERAEGTILYKGVSVKFWSDKPFRVGEKVTFWKKITGGGLLEATIMSH